MRAEIGDTLGKFAALLGVWLERVMRASLEKSLETWEAVGGRSISIGVYEGWKPVL